MCSATAPPIFHVQRLQSHLLLPERHKGSFSSATACGVRFLVSGSYPELDYLQYLVYLERTASALRCPEIMLSEHSASSAIHATTRPRSRRRHGSSGTGRCSDWQQAASWHRLHRADATHGPLPSPFRRPQLTIHFSLTPPRPPPPQSRPPRPHRPLRRALLGVGPQVAPPPLSSSVPPLPPLPCASPALALPARAAPSHPRPCRASCTRARGYRAPRPAAAPGPPARRI
mmetsp:Transcript_56817/g.126877  ORF Transcript_56817/g.126877 Transcript_56817/m.126877 type:complete len:230 (-) Transcript_56817:1309-1998(-)